MAAGKVVFSGFQKECLESYEHYNGEEVGVPASLNEDELFGQFCEIICDKRRMERISENAIKFVKDNHEANIIAKQF